ncbi:hypothetical protein HNQ96_005752 [Aminobacter lissarensis]|uniref:Uncharacterized protein n=1 Tax=Aminobacter carboxidus TaxID=376165 RepID=A0A8E1WKT9_9HYPH|nr:hypothetical protein [Aminobacter lissarensis]
MRHIFVPSSDDAHTYETPLNASLGKHCVAFAPLLGVMLVPMTRDFVSATNPNVLVLLHII